MVLATKRTAAKNNFFMFKNVCVLNCYKNE